MCALLTPQHVLCTTPYARPVLRCAVRTGSRHLCFLNSNSSCMPAEATPLSLVLLWPTFDRVIRCAHRHAPASRLLLITNHSIRHLSSLSRQTGVLYSSPIFSASSTRRLAHWSRHRPAPHCTADSARTEYRIFKSPPSRYYCEDVYRRCPPHLAVQTPCFPLVHDLFFYRNSPSANLAFTLASFNNQVP